MNSRGAGETLAREHPASVLGGVGTRVDRELDRQAEEGRARSRTYSRGARALRRMDSKLDALSSALTKDLCEFSLSVDRCINKGLWREGGLRGHTKKYSYIITACELQTRLLGFTES